jgi:signal transduction histidine kinase
VQALVDDLVEQGAPVSCRTEPAVTQTEPVALRRIVGNLIENAIRYGDRRRSMSRDATTAS